MIYTTGWARQDCKTLSDWEQWLSSLRDGDEVLYQQFVKRGNFCLDSQVECWRFWPAKFFGERVSYDGDNHPLQDGRATYWNSDSLHGDVFGSRIVPAHRDLMPQYKGARFVDAHAPVFEPLWSEVDRCLVRVSYGANFHNSRRQVMHAFPQSYEREVYDGEVITVFAAATEVEEFCGQFNDNEIMFLYAEETGR